GAGDPPGRRAPAAAAAAPAHGRRRAAGRRPGDPGGGLVSEPFRIRPARVADAEAISEIYCDTLGPGYTSPAVVAEELAAGPRGAYFVAEAGGAVVGAANAVWIPRQEMLEVGNV